VPAAVVSTTFIPAALPSAWGGSARATFGCPSRSIGFSHRAYSDVIELRTLAVEAAASPWQRPVRHLRSRSAKPSRHAAKSSASPKKSLQARRACTNAGSQISSVAGAIPACAASSASRAGSASSRRICSLAASIPSTEKTLLRRLGSAMPPTRTRAYMTFGYILCDDIRVDQLGRDVDLGKGRGVALGRVTREASGPGWAGRSRRMNAAAGRASASRGAGSTIAAAPERRPGDASVSEPVVVSELDPANAILFRVDPRSGSWLRPSAGIRAGAGLPCDPIIASLPLAAELPPPTGHRRGGRDQSEGAFAQEDSASFQTSSTTTKEKR
jgi:hypothetical protein